MNRIFTSIILTVLCVGFLSAQTSIGGIINSYAKVDGINNVDICNPILSVDDASPFSVGDHLMIIQMKGAEIDVTDSPTFGNITNMNSAGLYEKTTINQIIGNDIYISTQIVNNYDVNSSVQIVDIPQYVDATVDSDITAYFWDGEKGGIIAFEVENTLTLNANITASFAGFRGGVSDNVPTQCSWANNHDSYFYPDGSDLGDSKGEGIAEFYSGKENGRGPQGNGGGGGNDHNAGGGGGSNFGNGGAGGMNLNPNPLQCLGQSPGLGGYSVANLGERLLFGGGGGTGHMNNNSGSQGGDGGGIVYIKATTIEGFWQGIRANGKLAFTAIADDGAGGGGGGGTLLIDAQNLVYGLTLATRGGDGGDSNLFGNAGCMGAGGGGGGGIVFTSLPPTDPNLYVLISGGENGVITNSTSPCNGVGLGSSPGADGILLTSPTIAEGITIEHMTIDNNPMDVSICNNDTGSFSITTDLMADNYQWQIDDGSGYTMTTDGGNYSGSNTSTIDISNLPAGNYMIQCMVNGGCNDALLSEPATLEVLETASVTVDPIDQDICETEMFSLYAEATGSNVTYQWQVNDGSGYVDIVNNATYNGSMMNTLDVQASAAMEGYTYQCVVSNDCPGSDVSAEATISLAPLPVPDFTFYVNEDTVFVQNNSTGYDNYYWDFGTGEPLEPGGAPYYIFEQGGTYFVTIYAINDCGTTSTTYPISVIPTGIFDTEIEQLDFIISPNPTRGIVNLDMSAETYQEARIRIYDVTGQLLQTEITNESQLVLDFSNYASGTYLLQVSIEGKSFTKKVIKQ